MLLFGGYALVTDKLVSEYENKTLRYPATGILTVAEPQDFGPADASVAALLIHGDEAASRAASEKAFKAIKSSDKRAIWLERSNHHLFWDYERERVY